MTAHPTPDVSAHAEQFIASVMAVAPQLAVFDCDGTLWAPDCGEQFFYWEIGRGLLPADVVEWAKARYRDYKNGMVDEETMCGEMVTLHRGIQRDVLERAAEEFFEERIASVIFPDMLDLTRRLRDAGCVLWAVSSTNAWVVEAGARRFGIPPERVIAACVHIQGGCATDRLVRVPTDDQKAVAIRDLLPRVPDAVFGNSMHDFPMLELAKHAFVVNPNPDLERVARERGWTVYQPEIGRSGDR